MIFGAVTIICGIVGTLSGGFILDRVTATIPNAFKVKKSFSSSISDYSGFYL